ncbi:ABC transporter permease subunit [Micromonospora sp. NPDC047738]|uniref:ABC transporter permease subunit n=1 Tax=Micromonospora sp. NPDC047738 TaxID=3155741 RepID=UPI0033C9C490
MSTVTEVRTAGAGAGPVSRPTYKVTGRRVLRSEWAKLWTLRSTWITLALGLAGLLVFGSIAAVRYKSLATSGGTRAGSGEFVNASAVTLTLFGVRFGQLALGVLGVLFAAGEYSTGMIRSTLAAVPRRLPVLWSKAAVYGVVAFVVGVAGAFGGFLIVNAVVNGTPAHMSLSGSGVARSLLGAGLYLSLVGVIGTALGMLMRSVPGAISVLVATLLLVPGLLSLLPTSWQDNIGPYLPSNAGEALYALHHAPGTLSAGTGALVLLGWTVLALAGGAYRLVRKDA